MPRKHYEWKLRDKTLQLGERTLVMGILNVTPDSFSDGGKYDDPDRAFARAIELEEEGADIIDIGAESTRPGSARISEAEELRRLVPVLKRLRDRLTVPISVDTYKAGVAAKALELGADIINDPTGLTMDPDLAKAVTQGDAGLILNHMRGTPDTWAKLPPLKDPISTIAIELGAAMHRAVRAGVERKRIVADPGLGFGKRKEQNSEILGRLDELAGLDLPLMIGPSRKHFLSKDSPLETEFASAAAVAAAILYGAHIVRIHDVKAMRAVIEVTDEIARARAVGQEAAETADRAARQESRREAPRDRRSREPGPREFRSQDSRPRDAAPREPRPPQTRPQDSRGYDDRRESRQGPGQSTQKGSFERRGSSGSRPPSRQESPGRPSSGRHPQDRRGPGGRPPGNRPRGKS
ncbi:MAG TPA: dihydropteroate synthase [Bryobacteraceae bacterium]|nr:dihydropteroate synthase [Bryobacteraceae bacterium]